MSRTRRRTEARMRSRVCSFAQCLDDLWLQQELEGSEILSSPRHPPRLHQSSDPASAVSTFIGKDTIIMPGHETWMTPEHATAAPPVEPNSRPSSAPSRVSRSQRLKARFTPSISLSECPCAQNCRIAAPLHSTDTVRGAQIVTTF